MSSDGARGPVELFSAMFAATEALDIRGWLDLFHDDAVTHFPYFPDPYPKRCDGRAEFEPFMVQAEQMFTRFRWSHTDVIRTTDEDLAIARASSEGLLVNGERYTNDYVLFIGAEDGRIREYSEYFDPARAMAAFAVLAA